MIDVKLSHFVHRLVSCSCNKADFVSKIEEYHREGAELVAGYAGKEMHAVQSRPASNSITVFLKGSTAMLYSSLLLASANVA
jgi:hypothetical protein